MDLVVYQFSRSKVERGDFSHFLDIYAPEKLPRGPRLREMMNSMAFMIEGFDDDPREIHSIPQVRSFYTAFRAAWPYWLYFCNLDSEEFQMMVLCCLPSISALKVDERANVTVELDVTELSEFLRANLSPMTLLCQRADMFDRLIYERTKAIFEYFKLPFDNQPPK